jgi:hypothetical protein
MDFCTSVPGLRRASRFALTRSVLPRVGVLSYITLRLFRYPTLHADCIVDISNKETHDEK